MGNVVIGGTATGATALPTYPTTVDRANDLLAIYSNANTGTYSITPNNLLQISGAPVGTTDTQTLTNKTLNGATIGTSTLSNTNTATFKDGSLTLENTSDTTKKAILSLASITTGTTRTYTLPDVTDTIVTLTATQTLTNKTLTTPTITGGTQSSPAITTPKITTSINDSNGNASMEITATASAVNQFTVANAATGNPPTLSVTGTDTNIGMSLSVKGSGNLTGVVENMKNPYKFDVYRHASYTTTSGANTKMPYDTKAFDTGSNYDNVTNYRFTAPITGFYQFNASMVFAADTRANIMLYKNGSEFVRGGDVNSSNLGVNVAALISLTATDYIEVFYFHASAVAITVDITRFSGFLVSKA